MSPFIENKRLRYIIPFKFKIGNNDIKSIIEFVDNKDNGIGGRWQVASIKKNEQDIYQYVLNDFATGISDARTSLGVAFSHICEGEESNVIELCYQKNKSSSEVFFSIADVGLYLFASGIGFLWYEIDDTKKEHGLSQLSLEELIVFNNSFKELNYYENQRKCHKVNSDEEFTLGDTWARVLKITCESVDFFGKRSNTVKKSDAPTEVPDKALLFNYIHFYKDILLDEKKMKRFSKYVDNIPEEKVFDWDTVLTETAYYMSKGYKRSYEIPSNGVNLYKPFSNAFWYVTKEGAGYYVVSSKDRNNEFFAENMYKKVMNDYFNIYILALHQSYTLLGFAEEISNNLPTSKDEYIDYSDDEENGESLDKYLRDLVTRINLFITKNVRASISYIGHQNEFFVYVKEQLSVKQDAENVTQGLESLQELLHESKMTADDEKEKRKENRLSFVVGILSMVAFVSVVYDGLCLINDYFLSEQMTYANSLIDTVPIYKIWFCIFVIIFIFVLIGVWVVLSPRIAKMTERIAKKFNKKGKRK